MKKLLIDTICKDLSSIKLAGNKRGALIDFLSILPKVATKAYNIQHGFIKVGIIDADNHQYPVFNKMLATYHCNPIQEEYEYAKTNFPQVRQETWANFLRAILDAWNSS